MALVKCSTDGCGAKVTEGDLVLPRLAEATKAGRLLPSSTGGQP